MSATTTELDELGATVRAAVATVAVNGLAPEGIKLERPPRAEYGDYSTNAALLLAASLEAPPREVAKRLGEELSRRMGADLERFEVAGPGFVNMFLGDAWCERALAAVLDAGERYGAGGAARPERVLVEFVSANPTGPMHVGHARNAAYGDALARLLEWHGHEVTREFYVNDAGTQVRKLGESIAALARGEEVPQDGYRGAYVGRLVQRLGAAAGEQADAAQLGQAAVGLMVEEMRSSLQAFGVREFDRWQHESALHEGRPSRVERVLAALEQGGHTYHSEGALWLRTTAYGDDKDRVLVRANGDHTYFAADVAYHQDKRERGFERQIDVWGADHHGYVARMKAAYVALGGDAEDLELLIMQLVHLLRRGARAQMSKRAGEFVTLAELVREIGVDAARWFLLSRSHDTTIDLDLDLARAESSENPVYYVQYAHARIASMLAKAGAERVAAAMAQAGTAGTEVGRAEVEAGVAGAEAGVAAAQAGRAGAETTAALHPSERALIKQLLAFPNEAREAAERRAPHRITVYALQLAQDFTAFYRDCRVVGAQPAAVESQRIAVCVAAQRTIARCLEDLLGVGAPAEM